MKLRVLSSLLLLFFPAWPLAAQTTSNAQKFSPPTRTFRFTYNFTVKLYVKRKTRVGGLNFWAFEVAWAANWHAGKQSSSNDERTRSFTETLLNPRTWIEILPAANASCQGCGGRHSIDNLYPWLSLGQDVSLSNISNLV